MDWLSKAAESSSSDYVEQVKGEISAATDQIKSAIDSMIDDISSEQD